MRHRQLMLGQLAALGILTSGACHAHCSISVQDLAFGSYDVLNPLPMTSSAAITINCKAPILITINIGPSMTTSTVLQRAMRHQIRADTLSYNLFRDSAYSQVWGDDGQAGGKSQRVSGQVTLWIYGLLYPKQDVWVGNYSDSVTVTVLP